MPLQLPARHRYRPLADMSRVSRAAPFAMSWLMWAAREDAVGVFGFEVRMRRGVGIASIR